MKSKWLPIAALSAFIGALLIAPAAGVAADDLKVAQLEQDVHELQRQVQALSRQLEMQRVQPALPGVPPKTPSMAAAINVTPTWVDAAKWQKLMPGMSELEVVSLLGPPTSLRTNGAQKILLYALEIGASGFLSGNVTLSERAVVSIQKPALQ